MARKREEPPAEAPEQVSEMAQREAEDAAGQTNGQVESEVRPEELAQGIEKTVWRSPFPEEVTEALRAPLDPNRVRRRSGRGGGEFEYLAGHDVKRQMNTIFGFGNWGTKVVRVERLGQVPVVSSGGKPGWHVGYLAVVQVRVRTEVGDWVSYEDDGYGDGAEYGPAALITARELAVKEAVTDAFKRACTYLGDQFGLILYAKQDEKARIVREQNAADARPPVRVDPPGPPVPKSWAEAFDRFDKRVDDEGQSKIWAAQLVKAMFGKETLQELTAAERAQVSAAFFATVLAVEAEEGELALRPDYRDLIARLFAKRSRGAALFGPDYALNTEEATKGMPSREEWLASEAALAG